MAPPPSSTPYPPPRPHSKWGPVRPRRKI
jgi:hypothetical protein